MKKLRQKFTIILLTFAIFTTSCYKNKLDYTIVNETNETKEDNKDNVKTINIEEYKDYFKNISYNYKNEELYLSSDDVKNIIMRSQTIKDCNYKFDGNIEELINTIKSNSEKYISENKGYYSAFITDLSDENFYFLDQSYFEVALNVYLSYLYQNATNNVDEDFCNMKDLSIVYGYLNGNDNESENLTLATYNDEEKLIVLDYEAIGYNLVILRIMYPKLNLDEIGIIKIVLAHEINHLRQKSCECRINSGQLFNSIEYESNYVTTLTEASAESDIYNNCHFYGFTDIKASDYNYANERKKESYILMLGLVGKTKKDYYNAIFDTDLGKLYEFVGAKEEEDINNFYHILYAIDAVNNRNDYFSKLDEEDTSYEERRRIVGYEYRYEIFNKVVLDLIDYTEKNDISVEENLTVFRIIESLLLNEGYIPTDELDYCDFFEEETVKKFYMTSQKYIEFLKEYYNLSTEEFAIYYDISSNIIIDIQCKINKIVHNSESAEIKLKSNNVLREFPLLESIMKANQLYVFTTKTIYDSFSLSLK